jgi:hypothetical protein
MDAKIKERKSQENESVVAVIVDYEIDLNLKRNFN